MINEIQKELQESIEVKQSLLTLAPLIEKAAKMIVTSLRSGGKIILCGNGGSAADAQHIAAELMGRFEAERQALPCIAITGNSSNLTAISNDYGFSAVFARQVEALAARGDIVMGISTSGNSDNVIEALATAKEKGSSTIGLSGGRGGRLAEIADLCITVTTSRTCRIQEGHITIGHILCHQVEKAMKKGSRSKE